MSFPRLEASHFYVCIWSGQLRSIFSFSRLFSLTGVKRLETHSVHLTTELRETRIRNLLRTWPLPTLRSCSSRTCPSPRIHAPHNLEIEDVERKPSKKRALIRAGNLFFEASPTTRPTLLQQHSWNFRNRLLAILITVLQWRSRQRAL